MSLGHMPIKPHMCHFTFVNQSIELCESSNISDIKQKYQ
jgi:hypothetical protein